MALSDNNPVITLDDVGPDLRFVLVNTETGETKRGTFLGEPFENSREEHVVSVQYEDGDSVSQTELVCFGLTPTIDGTTHGHLILLADELS